VPKLVDFGIARLEAADAGRTRAGSVLGTPHYMSPEQLRSSRDATPASDIFSLGVVLYELACGRPPFEGETDFEVCRRIVEGRYVPPDRCRPGLDTALARAIEVALEPDPGRRFRSCDDMADFLGARVAPSPAAPRGLVLRLAVDGALHTLGREGEAVHFGARPDNDVVIDRPGISGRHARLLDHAGEVQVEDLGSTNGTWLEGRRLAPHAPVPLPHGARVHLGRHVAFTAAAMVLAPPPPSNRAAAGPPAPAPPRRGSVDPRPSPVPFPDIPAAAADVPAPPLASPPERLLARMVDGLCGLAVTLVLLALVDPPGRPSPSLARWQETADFLRTPAASGFHLFLNVFTPLVAAAFLATRGQTPGKVATGLRVEQPDGSRPAFARMLLRELLPTLVMIASPIAMVGDGGWRWALVALGFVDVFFVFGPFHRSLHDRIAGTVVRHVR
jgi:uncharacterized RDD family membrane protein YckC